MPAHFELISDLMSLNRRDMPLAAENILNPFDANPLIEGEFLEQNASGQLARGTGEGVSALVYPVHTERGRYDTQAIKLANVLFLGMYEAETKVADLTALAVGDELTVQDVTYLGGTKRGVKKAAAQAGRCIVGVVSKLPGSGKVRFVHFANYKKA